MKKVLVTGSNRGIGLELCKQLTARKVIAHIETELIFEHIRSAGLPHFHEFG